MTHAAQVPAGVEYQPRSALALDLLRTAREAGRLPGGWVTTWHGEGFEPDLRAGLEADGWRYLLPVSMTHRVFASADAADARPVADVLAADTTGALTVRRIWEGEDRHAGWLLGCTDALSGSPVAFVSNAADDEAPETFERVVATHWGTARLLAARCAGVSLDVYRVRGWDGWHHHVALALLASAFRACLPSAQVDALEAEASVDELPAFPEPIVLHPVDDAASEVAHVVAGDEDGSTGAYEAELAPAVGAEAELVPFPPMAGPTTYRLVVDLLDTDWRPVRAFQTWLVANEAGTSLESAPSRAEIERQDVGARMEVRFESEHSLEQIVEALDEVPEIVVAELYAEAAGQATGAGLAGADDLLAALDVTPPRPARSGRTSREHGATIAICPPATWY
jgi:P2 response regulator binding domain